VSCGGVFVESCRQQRNGWLIREAGGKTCDYSLTLDDSVQESLTGLFPASSFGGVTA